MEQLTRIFSITFVIVLLALLGMCLGYFLGKKVLRKQCGQDPNKKQDGECGKNPNCELCSNFQKPKPKE